MSRETRHSVCREQGHRIKSEDRRDFAKGINLLNRVLARVQEYEPEANYYLAMETLNLMLGASHEDGLGMKPRQDRVALDAAIWQSGGGDW